jgi:putative tricarboxylic transport membrane protein
VPVFATILRVPFGIIAPIILVVCAIGAYTVHNNFFDVVMMLVFGVIGYLLKKTQLSARAAGAGDRAGRQGGGGLPAVAAGLRGSIGVFFSNALVSTIMALGLIALFWPVISAISAASAANRPAGHKENNPWDWRPREDSVY